MKRTVTSTDAVRGFGELLSAVKHGREEIVITRNGTAVAKLSPVTDPETLTLEGFVEFWESTRAGSAADASDFAADLEAVQLADSPLPNRWR